MNFYLNVASIKHHIFSGLVKKICINGFEGALNIYPGHSPLLTMVNPGLLNIFEKDNKNILIYLDRGALEVQPNTTYIVVREAIFIRDLDYHQLLNRYKEINSQISSVPKNEIQFLKDQLVKIKIQLNLLNKI